MASPVHRRSWHGEILVAAADDQTGNFLVSGWVPQSILRFERLDALSDLGEIFLRERNIAGLCVGDGLLGLVAAAALNGGFPVLSFVFSGADVHRFYYIQRTIPPAVY